MVGYYFDIETTGLNPFKHKVLTTQLKKAGGDLRVWKIWQEKDETSMILDFLKHLNRADRYDPI